MGSALGASVGAADSAGAGDSGAASAGLVGAPIEDSRSGFPCDAEDSSDGLPSGAAWVGAMPGRVSVTDAPAASALVTSVDIDSHPLVMTSAADGGPRRGSSELIVSQGSERRVTYT